MTSAISYSSIDETYPVAGQDNNSQGFRDNFNYIKAGLTTAASEITALQTNTAKTNADNDFAANLIENFEYNNAYGTVASVGTISGATNVELIDGVYQTFTIANDLTLTFREWGAAGVLSKLTVELKSDGSARIVTFSGSPTPTILTNFGAVTYTLSATATTRSIFNVWSTTGGTTVFIEHVGNFTL